MKQTELDKLKSQLVGLKSEAANVSASNGGRKAEILAYLKDGAFAIKELSAKVGITEKNVSSILCYLRKDGNVLNRDSLGRLKYAGNIKELEAQIAKAEAAAKSKE